MKVELRTERINQGARFEARGTWTAATLSLLVCLLMLCGCDVEMSHNGDLDGLWRLEAIDTIATNGHHDMGEELRAWSFQNKLLELRDHTATAGAFLLRFDHHDNQLRTYAPYVFNRESGDYPVEDPAFLKPFGIHKLDTHFVIDQLSSSRMCLRDDTLILHFRKLN